MTEFLTIIGKDIYFGTTPIKLRGVNHNNQLALCARVGSQIFGSCDIADVDIVEADYALMASNGINHVRWGMSYRWYADDRTGFFRVLDQHVAWAKLHNIWIIWNLFTTPNDCYEGFSQTCPIWTDAAEQTALINFWVDMATHFLNEPVVAGFGLLNEPEPPGPGYSTTWDTFAQQIINAIRAVNTRTIIAVATTSGAIFNHTFTGGNILYEVHDYLPGAISHATSSVITWPGNAVDYDSNTYYWDKEALKGNPPNPMTDIGQRLPIDWAAANNVPLYIGEWGCKQVATGHVQYVLDHADVFNNFYDLNHAFFVWRGGPAAFALFPINVNPPTPFSVPMLNAAKTSWNGFMPTFASSSGQGQQGTFPLAFSLTSTARFLVIDGGVTYEIDLPHLRQNLYAFIGTMVGTLSATEARDGMTIGGTSG